MSPENGGHKYMCDMRCRCSPVLLLWALRAWEEGGGEKGKGGRQKEQRGQTMWMDIYGWNSLGSEESRCKSFVGPGENFGFYSSWKKKPLGSFEWTALIHDGQDMGCTVKRVYLPFLHLMPHHSHPHQIASVSFHQFAWVFHHRVGSTQIWVQQSSLTHGAMFQDSRWMPETTNSTKPCIYYLFPLHTYLW